MRTIFAASVLVLSIGLGCATEPTPAHGKPPTTTTLEPYSCGTVERLHTYAGIFLASQPQPADFEQASQGGIKSIVNLRQPDEVKEFDERALVEGLGMEYLNVPFSKPDELTDEVFDRVRALLRDPARKPMMVHCSSGNRVGAIWLAHRVLDGGLSLEDALVEAKAVGLKTPTLEERAKQYISSHARTLRTRNSAR